MFTKGETVYADAYKYLRHKTENIIALSVKGSADNYDELPMNEPFDVEIVGSMVFWHNRNFANILADLTKDSVKTSIIKSRYNNDDQLAILLNKDEDEKGVMYYRKMQEWREFAACVAQMVSNKEILFNDLELNNIL